MALPHGTGKVVKALVFVDDEDDIEKLNAPKGTTIGGPSLIEGIMDASMAEKLMAVMKTAESTKVELRLTQNELEIATKDIQFKNENQKKAIDSVEKQTVNQNKSSNLIELKDKKIDELKSLLEETKIKSLESKKQDELSMARREEDLKNLNNILSASNKKIEDLKLSKATSKDRETKLHESYSKVNIELEKLKCELNCSQKEKNSLEEKFRQLETSLDENSKSSKIFLNTTLHSYNEQTTNKES